MKNKPQRTQSAQSNVKKSKEKDRAAKKSRFMGTSVTCVPSRAVIEPFSGGQQEHWRNWGGEEPNCALTY